MSELDPEQLVLSRARRAFSPSAEDAARVLRSVELAAGTAAGSSAAGSSAAGAAQLAAGAVKVVAGALVVASAALGGYWLGLRDGRAESKAEPPGAVAAPTAVAAPIAVAAPPGAVAAPPIADTAPVAVASSAASDTPPPSAAATLASKQRPAAPSIQLEIRAMRRVDRALRDGRPELALRLLAELDRDVPHGQMREERAAGRAVARCTRAASRAIADEFAARHPESVYAERVLAACEENR